MAMKTLHITNGTNLTAYLNDLGYKGQFLTWQEMLCEGPTTEEVDSEHFIKLRKEFLLDFYDIEMNEAEFKKELDLLNHPEIFQKVILWFEYDLFCHINLLAIISLLKQKKIDCPLYLVCSGRVKGEKDLKALSELQPEQLHQHFEKKISLSADDVDLITSLWRIYCGKDHNLFKPFIVKRSSFPYLSSCLKAHLQRFPDSITGLSTLEMHTLKMIANQKVKSRRHLLGYILNFQGYYGFNTLQINQMIDTLDLFYTEEENQMILNRAGHEAIDKQRNFSTEMTTALQYGGVKKIGFQFDQPQNKLIKTLL